MAATRRCHKETLNLMLVDPRVEIRDNLEMLVGEDFSYSHTHLEKEEIVGLIQEERQRRKRRQTLQEIRAPVRNHYSVNIEKLRQQIEEEEQSARIKEAERNKTKEKWMKRLNVRKEIQKREKSQWMERLQEERVRMEERQREERLNMEEKQKSERNDLEKRYKSEMTQIQKSLNNEITLFKCLETRHERQVKEEQNSLNGKKETLRNIIRDKEKLEMHGDIDVGAARQEFQCPVCLDMMIPPKRIWMCSASHLVCESCKNRLQNNKRCPTCRGSQVTIRALFAENVVRALFVNQ